MRIAAIRNKGKATLAVRRNGELIDLGIAAPKLPRDLRGLIEGGSAALKAAAAAAKKAKGAAVVKGKVQYLPPIANSRKIICVGLNYADHATESNMQKPSYPVLFLRVATTLVAHNQPLIRPKLSGDFDYEGEMVVVIGRRGRHIARDKALGFVAGYSVFNEGSIRDYQFKTPQWTVGKNFDGTGGFGPEFVTADELPKGAKGLRIQTRLNGQVVQDANTNDMIFDVADLVSISSESMTLEPGDVIVSGTPSGVGAFRKPPLWMKNGDVCEVEIEGIGTLSNPIKNEK